MNIQDKMRTIGRVAVTDLHVLDLLWSDGTAVRLDVQAMLADRAFAALRDADAFTQVSLGDWGHSLVWPCGAEMSADMLWLETLSQTGHEDTRTFLEWRLRHALSLSKAGDALGVSRRMIAYYSNGEKPVPKLILLACRGWEVLGLHTQAA